MLKRRDGNSTRLFGIAVTVELEFGNSGTPLSMMTSISNVWLLVTK